MNSREKIIAAVKANQPEPVGLPDITVFDSTASGSLEKFAKVLTGIGGRIAYVSDYDEVVRLVVAEHGNGGRFVSHLGRALSETIENIKNGETVHDLRDVEVAILKGRFGVAENGAVWITENDMGYRVLPFITQHLAVVIDASAIVPTMHEAYNLISPTTYDYGTFIAGPSKTADIEQSLVTGAHGPRSMTVFVMTNDEKPGEQPPAGQQVPSGHARKRMELVRD